MGCTTSISKIYTVGRRKKTISIPETVVFVPSMRVPVRSDLQRTLRGLIPRDVADKLSSLRNQIVLVAEETGLVLQRLLFLYIFCLVAEKM